MKINWQKLTEWWGGLAMREQRILMLGGGLVVFFILYQIVWAPLDRHADSLRKEIAAQQKLLAWMRVTDQALAQFNDQLPRKTLATNPALLLGYLQKRIEAANLKASLKQLKQVGNDAIEIHLQKVAFDPLIVMLVKAVKEQGFTISRMTITASVTPGIVNADVTVNF